MATSWEEGKCGELLNYNFDLFNAYRAIQIIYLSWLSFGNIVFLTNWSILSQLFNSQHKVACHIPLLSF